MNNEERIIQLLEQILDELKSVPKLSMMYGGTNLGLTHFDFNPYAIDKTGVVPFGNPESTAIKRDPDQ